MGEIKVSPDYNWFRSTVPLKKVCTAAMVLWWNVSSCCGGWNWLMQNSAGDLVYPLKCCPMCHVSAWKHTLHFHMLLGGPLCMWWWGTEAHSCEPQQQYSASWFQPCPRRRLWGAGVCWAPHAGPLMEHQGRAADPATTQPCCQSHLCSAYTLFLGVEMCLNHGGKCHVVSSAVCPWDVFCLTTLSNHFLFSLGFLHSLLLNHRRVFEVSSAPPSAEWQRAWSAALVCSSCPGLTLAHTCCR